MDLQLSGKRILITGASMGIGAHLAETFAAENAHLHLTARSTDTVSYTHLTLTTSDLV